MNDQSTRNGNQYPPLDMGAVQTSSMALATARTISVLNQTGEIDQRDFATARLAMEVAERIDADGLECGISLFPRLHSLLLDLHHEGRDAKCCPLAQQLVQVPGEVTKSE